MLAAYIITGVIGIGLIVVSLFTGHGDHPGHGDHEFDHDSGFDSWLPFFSLRFWTYTLGVFGLCGVLLTYLSDAKEPFIVVASIVTGLIVGFGVSFAMRALRKVDTGALEGEKTLVGKTGKLLVGIRKDQEGKVRIQAGDETVDMIARGYDAEEIPLGTEVVIVALEGDRALVMAHSVLEN